MAKGLAWLGFGLACLARAFLFVDERFHSSPTGLFWQAEKSVIISPAHDAFLQTPAGMASGQPAGGRRRALESQATGGFGLGGGSWAQPAPFISVQGPVLSTGGRPEGGGGRGGRRPPPSAPRMQGISVMLSVVQVGHVLREATGSRGLRNMLVGQVDDLRVAIAAVLEDPELNRQQVSYSTLKALDVWCAFAPPGTVRGIHEIARELGMNASTTHRYAQTLLEIGLLEQSPQTRKYRIPPEEHASAPESDAMG
jgi:hypothetical protein